MRKEYEISFFNLVIVIFILLTFTVKPDSTSKQSMSGFQAEVCLFFLNFKIVKL